MKAKGIALVGVLITLLVASALTVDRNVMAKRIESAGNSRDVHLCFRYLAADAPVPESYADVPLQVLLPAFMLSELKNAFLVGFQVGTPCAILVLLFRGIRKRLGRGPKNFLGSHVLAR